ncbi:hypothetical protein K437DRAFT_56931 [Tilletiaria anomala UBC 951]|uniref:Uncharacterized protein n=1 Tax=Tilletiaria anomala (strain ATCC 24038 / CBS 436.72 / UBC 951) TaxID=1037660 RepID=A0A066V7X1_TILAU|nr:uncharacterized protein K437DRAFT_56931 [Tilletiaria anomala UBC 951]KDN36353.1 hypothetical protein K437DRAFT_56931 [Tilletiaria anomala UBC 951]
MNASWRVGPLDRICSSRRIHSSLPSRTATLVKPKPMGTGRLPRPTPSPAGIACYFVKFCGPGIAVKDGKDDLTIHSPLGPNPGASTSVSAFSYHPRSTMLYAHVCSSDVYKSRHYRRVPLHLWGLTCCERRLSQHTNGVPQRRACLSMMGG